MRHVCHLIKSKEKNRKSCVNNVWNSIHLHNEMYTHTSFYVTYSFTFCIDTFSARKTIPHNHINKETTYMFLYGIAQGIQFPFPFYFHFRQSRSIHNIIPCYLNIFMLTTVKKNELCSIQFSQAPGWKKNFQLACLCVCSFLSGVQ